MKILVVNSDRSGIEGEPINLGDAMLTDALVEAMRSVGHVVSVAEFGETARRSAVGRVDVHGLISLLAAIRGADAVVVGGGTLLQDDGPALGGLPRLVAATSVSAWLTRRPLSFYGVGCDPVTRFWPRVFLKLALWRRAVWARDTASVARCRRLARSSRVALGADAFLLADDQGPSERVRAGAVLALAPAEAPELGPVDWERLRNRYGSVRFVAMSQTHPHDDRAALQREVREGVSQEVIHLWSDLAHDVKSTGAVVASRMHALYLGLACQAPLVAVGNKAKVRAFAEEFDIPLVATVSEASEAEPAFANAQAVHAAKNRARLAFAEMMTGLAS